MLKVSIEHENYVSECRLKARREGELMAVIAREIYSDDMTVCLAYPFDQPAKSHPPIRH